MTGNILIKDAGFIRTNTGNSVELGNSSNFVSFNPANFMEIQIDGEVKASLNTGTFRVYGNISPNNNRITEVANPTSDSDAATKGYVDTQIESIPTPDVSGQIETHNTALDAHANMGWITAEDEILSNIDPDGAIDAATLEGHPASYFATKDDLSSIDVSDQLANYVLKSELSTLVPQPDLTNYYTKAQVDEKITQIQNLINQAAALVDEINGEVI